MARRIIETWWGGHKADQFTSKRADINSQEAVIDKTTATYTLQSLPPNAVVARLRYNITEDFDGALKLGNADDAEAYIADLIFPKTGAGIVVIGTVLTAAADIKLDVSGCSAGAGTFKLTWEI